MAANQVELEFNLNWADENPSVFTESVKDFMAKYKGWKILIDATRKHHVRFIAKLQTEAK